MGKNDDFRIGEWNAICDTCGLKFKSSQLRRTWNNFMACDMCWEPRHPQDFVRATIDRQRVPWSRPDGVSTYESTITKTTAGAEGDSVITVTALGSMAAGMNVGIQTDKVVSEAAWVTGDMIASDGYLWHWTCITSIATLTLTLDDRLPWAVSIGNEVRVLIDSSHLAAGDVTVASLG